MAVRASMADLIARTRTLIADTGSTPQFADQQIQDALDFRRNEIRFRPLLPQPTFAPGATITYLDYYSSDQNWESDAVLQDLSYNTLSPTLSEYIVGHWQFASQPNGIGVRITGKVYDIYGSAADLLDDWATSLALAYDFATDSQQYKRSQMQAQLSKKANDYRALALPSVRRMVQSDAAPQNEGGGVVYPNVGADYA